jgi:hypothetical protein
MEDGHPSLYLVYDYMAEGDLGKALDVLPGDPLAEALTEKERIKVRATAWRPARTYDLHTVCPVHSQSGIVFIGGS